MDKKLTAIYPSSHWGSNIGNAFFHLGGMYLINQARSDIFIHQADLPSEKAFFPNKKQLYYDYKYGNYLGAADFLILDGPMFDKNFLHLFGPMLKKAKEKNMKIVLLSTGGILYDEEEVAHCKEVLKKYKPFILTTRDHETFQNYGEFAENSYDGCCTAWFCPDYYPGYTTDDIDDYVSLCFDHTCEPKIDGEDLKSFNKVRIDDVQHSKLQKLKRLTQRNFPKKILNANVIRPTHQVLHRSNWRLYFKENSFFSQTPYGYLNIYRNTKLTITDRLHASVATLAYGNPARLMIRSKRAFLLNRMRVETVMNEIVMADMDYIKTEKKNYIEWMSNILNKV